MDFSKEALKEVIEKHGLRDFPLNELYEFVKEGGAQLNKQIVGIEEFITSPNYMNALTTDKMSIIYPRVMDEIIELNCGKYEEAVLTGGIGTAKTTVALYTQAYQLYLLSCYISPHAIFGLDPASEIEIIFQNLNATKSKVVEYDRFRSMLERSPYFRNIYPFDPEMKSTLNFPNRIIVKSVSGEISGTMGENVIGGILDEVNFMEVIDKSKRTHDGGEYDQADLLYNSLARRRESRFMKGGKLPGILCIVSSKRYPGEFTDKKLEEAKTDPTIFVYEKRIWEVKPQGTYGEARFEVFVGTETENPYIIETEEERAEIEPERILAVPLEYRKQFEQDLLDALREIGGISLRTVHPYLININAVRACFGVTKSILNKESVDFSIEKLGIIKSRIQKPEEPRFIHLDLGLTGDHTGMSMGYCDKFMAIDRGEDQEILPHIVFDFCLNIRPPKNGEVDYGRIRAFIYAMRKLGINIKWITMDSFQSADMIQQLRHKGYACGLVSVETKTGPYEIAKSAIYDDRAAFPNHSRLYKELINLELDEQKDKVDHPPKGSKDIADCVAGVIWGLSIRREVWARHKIHPSRVKDFIQRYMQQKDEKKAIDMDTKVAPSDKSSITVLP